MFLFIGTFMCRGGWSMSYSLFICEFMVGAYQAFIMEFLIPFLYSLFVSFLEQPIYKTVGHGLGGSVVECAWRFFTMNPLTYRAPHIYPARNTIFAAP